VNLSEIIKSKCNAESLRDHSMVYFHSQLSGKLNLTSSCIKHEACQSDIRNECTIQSDRLTWKTMAMMAELDLQWNFEKAEDSLKGISLSEVSPTCNCLILRLFYDTVSTKEVQ
jgi:hypothetical protein